MMSIIRGLIKAVRPAKSGGPARFDASGRPSEEFINREMFQHYGVSSRPPEGAECLILRSGGNVFLIASDDRRYKIGLNDGEVALHDAFRNVVHMQAGGNILVKAGGTAGKVAIEAAGEVSVNAAKAVVNAEKVLFGPATGEALAGTALTTANCMCHFLASLGTPGPHIVETGKDRVKIV
ncbi:MAG: phage baseplate assembly protein [Chitinispirillia bacterium]|nr:phage baseplate assembly protein [Chitinispirillia bacterium]MCL2268607.1 phage baseplate assembly protein [Chitinispirillia bacterium]